MSAEDFSARSRAAFAERFPAIAGRLKAQGGCAASVEWENNAPIDLRIDGRRLYGGDARRFALNQVEAFAKKPLRVVVQRLDLSGIITTVGKRLIEAIEIGLRDDRFGEFAPRPVDNPTFLIVFGLGLGHHIQPLVRETKARWLIVVEPMLEFFEPSCSVVDWAALDDEMKSRGGYVELVAETDPVRMVEAIGKAIGGKNIPYADGSWVFTHYPFWAFDEARGRLHEAMESAFINRGFFEDELVMMRNATANFAQHDFRLLEGRPRLRRPETAVIVGAGPSLDESIDTLRRIRDRVVLFSAGTALRALLSRGIVPDYHCELENVPAVHDVLQETAKLGDLSQITLIASATVDPRVPSLFADRIFYFRDTVSSTQILGRQHRELVGTAPTCVNLAVTAATFMGFTEFALFGTDCGSRPGQKRHAKGTVYADVERFQPVEARPMKGMQVEGNFGGIVDTELVYDLCRDMLAQAIKRYGLNAVNCSDGALIAGALPRVPEALEIATPAIDHATLRATINNATQAYAAGALLEEADFRAIAEKGRAMFADLDRLLAELGAGDPDFAAVYERVMDFVAEAGDRYGRMESMISGSLQALPRIGMFYGFRIASTAGRRRLFELFIAEFRDIARGMADEIFALFDELQTMMPREKRRAGAGQG